MREKIFFRIWVAFFCFSLSSALDENFSSFFFYKGEMVTDRLSSVALSENDFVRYVAAASSI